MDKRRFRVTWLMLLVAAIMLFISVSTVISALASQGDIVTWNGGNYEYGYQMWYLDDNWLDENSNPGVPQEGRQVFITNNNSQVAFNVLTPILGYMQIDNNSSLTFVGFGNLTASNTDVGYYGQGTINMDWGWHTINGDLTLGVKSGSQGNYNMGSGELNVNGYTIIGGGGTGVFTQTGTSTHVTQALFVGGNGTSGTGRYNLENGILTVSGDTFLGNGGTGTFYHTGGVHDVTGNLVIANNYMAGGGAYNLSGDSSTLTVGGNTYVGLSGTGTFNQDGGTHSITNELILGQDSYCSGIYTMTGGNLSVGQKEYVGYSGTGVFNQSGGTHTVGAVGGDLVLTDVSLMVAAPSGDLVLGNVYDSYGTYNLSGDPTLSTLTVKNRTYVGLYGTGIFVQNGGTHLADALYLGRYSDAYGMYTLNGGVLTTRRTGVGIEGEGVFYQLGGTHYVSEEMNIGVYSGSQGTYDMTGGTLASANEFVGNYGTGVFNQSGGTNYVGFGIDGHSLGLPLSELIVGRFSGSDGTYILSGGNLTVSREIVGDAGGIGTFYQSGESKHFIYEDLIIGQDSLNESASLGSFYLQGNANLTVNGYLYLGDMGGYGYFKQSETSQNTVINLNIGDSSENQDTSTSYLSVGVYDQTGGVNTVSNDLVLAVTSGSTGTYNLSGDSSTLIVGGTTVVGLSGKGTFTQDGGTHTTNVDLILADDSEGSGTYKLVNGTLTVIGAAIIGNDGTGTFIQNGGTNTVGGTEQYGALILGNLSGTGYYELNNGTLTVGIEEYIGNFGSGTFKQSGGTHTLNGAMYVGLESGGNGEYHMTGGQLTATDHITLGTNAGSEGKFFLNNGNVDAGFLHVGREGSGTFTQTGGTLTLAPDNEGLTIAEENGSTGKYDMQGGTLNTPSVTNNDTFLYKGVGLNVDEFTNNGVFQGEGTINPYTIGGTFTFTNNGTVAPGNSPGTLTINSGNYVQTGSLEIEIGGASYYDILHVDDGSASLTGTLDVVLYGAYTPELGSYYDILYASGGITTSSDLITINGPANWTWTLVYLDNDKNGSYETGRLYAEAKVVPVPPAAWLLGSGLLGLLGLRRKMAK